MPKLTKMSSAEVDAMNKKKSGQSIRAVVRQQYVDNLNTFQPGDWVSVEFDESEKRQTVRNRLKAAAKGLGYDLNFLRTRGSLIFEIKEPGK